MVWTGKLVATEIELTEIKTSFSKDMALEPDLIAALKNLPTKGHPMAWNYLL